MRFQKKCVDILYIKLPCIIIDLTDTTIYGMFNNIIFEVINTTIDFLQLIQYNLLN